MGKVRTACRGMDTSQPLDALLCQLNQALKGWCAYFRPSVSSRTFAYMSYYTWHQVGRWLRRKHRRSTWKDLRRRYYDAGWWSASEQRALFNRAKVATTRYRHRGQPSQPLGRARNENTRRLLACRLACWAADRGSWAILCWRARRVAVRE